VEKFIDHCCDECTHTKESPCRDFVRCCLEGPVCHENETCAQKRKIIMEKVALNEKFIIC